MALQKPLYASNTNPNVYNEFSPTADSVQLAQFVATGINGVGFDAQNTSVVNVLSPVNPNDGANKTYIDTAVATLTTLLNNTIAHLSLKNSAVVLANTNQTLSGLPTIQGVTLTAGQVVALTGQTTGTQNGLYNVAAGAWTRCSDLPTGASAAGAVFYVEQGTFAGQQWACTNIAGQDVVDTNALTFTIIQATPSGLSVSGTGLTYASGNISLNTAPAGAIVQTTGGLAAQVDGNAIQINGTNQIALLLASGGPLSASSSGLALSVQSGVFTQNGTLSLIGLPTTNSLNLLYQGNYADPVHKHAFTKYTFTNGSTALAAGVPVYLTSANTLAASDATSSATANCIGFTYAAIASGATGDVVTSGTLPGVFTGLTPGAPQYLAVGGGITTTPPSSSGNVVRLLGYAAGTTALSLQFGNATVRS